MFVQANITEIVEHSYKTTTTTVTKNMDIIIRDEDISLSQVALYASISFLVVSIVGAFLYITCTKKYRLNWFEKNLLETASDKEEMSQR